MKKRLFSNFWIKILSLGLAFILWYYITEDLVQEETIYPIKLQFINIPANLKLVKGETTMIKVIIKGTKKNIDKVRKKIKMVIDLKKAKLGENIYSLSFKNLKGIKKIKVLEISPQRLILELNE